MGGKAFAAQGDVVRITTARLEPIARDVVAATGARPVRWLRAKADHGDLDLVVPASLAAAIGDDALARRVADAVGVPHLSRRPDSRDPILFVGLRLPEGIFQADLICMPDALVDFAARHLSWGDLGLMLGRVAREMGLTLGQNGLRMPVRVTSAGRESVLLTSDFAVALEFLGWDPAWHDAGFDDDAEAADYVASGRLFDPMIFDPSRATGESRRKGRGRRGRDEYVSSLMSKPARYRWPETKGDASFQRPFLEAAMDRFGVREEIETMRARMLASLERRPSEFSTDAVLEASGFPEDDLRAVLSVLMESFPATGEYPAWKASCTLQELQDRSRAAGDELRRRREAEKADRIRRAAETERHLRNRERRARERTAAEGRDPSLPE